jgi:hypothetical protein
MRAINSPESRHGPVQMPRRNVSIGLGAIAISYPDLLGSGREVEAGEYGRCKRRCKGRCKRRHDEGGLGFSFCRSGRGASCL